MKHLLAALFLALAALAPGLGTAHEFTYGALEITHPWARFTPPGASNGAVYLVIENTGEKTERLLGAATPRAAKAELHATAMEGEVMTMRPRDAVEIKPKEIVAFEPGGLHIMLLGLTTPLQEGEMIPLTLRFETAGELTIEVMVERGGEMKMDHHSME
jgi:copper(I)-binding protein